MTERKNMLGLENWIVESKFFKTYFNGGPGPADKAAMLARQTRSRQTAERYTTRLKAFSAFAWKI